MALERNQMQHMSLQEKMRLNGVLSVEEEA
jgi:hypothetical protein